MPRPVGLISTGGVAHTQDLLHPSSQPAQGVPAQSGPLELSIQQGVGHHQGAPRTPDVQGQGAESSPLNNEHGAAHVEQMLGELRIHGSSTGSSAASNSPAVDTVGGIPTHLAMSPRVNEHSKSLPKPILPSEEERREADLRAHQGSYSIHHDLGGLYIILMVTALPEETVAMLGGDPAAFSRRPGRSHTHDVSLPAVSRDSSSSSSSSSSSDSSTSSTSSSSEDEDAASVKRTDALNATVDTSARGAHQTPMSPDRFRRSSLPSQARQFANQAADDGDAEVHTEELTKKQLRKLRKKRRKRRRARKLAVQEAKRKAERQAYSFVVFRSGAVFGGSLAQSPAVDQPLVAMEESKVAGRLEDPYASRVHVQLEEKNGAFYVTDLGSLNGTFIRHHAYRSPHRGHPEFGSELKNISTQHRYGSDIKLDAQDIVLVRSTEMIVDQLTLKGNRPSLTVRFRRKLDDATVTVTVHDDGAFVLHRETVELVVPPSELKLRLEDGYHAVAHIFYSKLRKKSHHHGFFMRDTTDSLALDVVSSRAPGELTRDFSFSRVIVGGPGGASAAGNSLRRSFDYDSHETERDGRNVSKPFTGILLRLSPQGRRSKPVRVFSGDLIRVGRTELIVCVSRRVAPLDTGGMDLMSPHRASAAARLHMRRARSTSPRGSLPKQARRPHLRAPSTRLVEEYNDSERHELPLVISSGAPRAPAAPADVGSPTSGGLMSIFAPLSSAEDADASAIAVPGSPRAAQQKRELYEVDEVEVDGEDGGDEDEQDELGEFEDGEQRQFGDANVSVVDVWCAEDPNFGQRNSMEDRSCIVDEFLNTGGLCDMFIGVYDGHGTWRISDFVCSTFHWTLYDELARVGAVHPRDGGRMRLDIPPALNALPPSMHALEAQASDGTELKGSPPDVTKSELGSLGRSAGQSNALLDLFAAETSPSRGDQDTSQSSPANETVSKDAPARQQSLQSSDRSSSSSSFQSPTLLPAPPSTPVQNTMVGQAVPPADMDVQWVDCAAIAEEERRAVVRRLMGPIGVAFLSAYRLTTAQLRGMELARYGGCTATTAMIYSDPSLGVSRLLVAGIGDTRAVLVRNGRALELTKDHKAGSPEETTRIVGAGGRVVNGRLQVAFGLDVSRSFGDLTMETFGLCSLPLLASVVLCAQDTHFVVATDGVWDVISSDQAAELLYNPENIAKSSQELSDMFVQKAKAKGSGDNLTCVVAKLAPLIFDG